MNVTARIDACEAHIRQFGYAGDMSPAEAWSMLEQQGDAVLVDVRTPQEWEQVGIPDLAKFGKMVVKLSWVFTPSREVNSQFTTEFARLPVSADTPVLLLCRSGGRSQAAAIALTKSGYSRCFNIAHGFEGPNGWKTTSLPWKL